MIRVLQYGMGANLGGIETFLFNLSRSIDPSQFRFDFLYSDQGQRPVFAPDLPESRFFGVTPRRVSPRRNLTDLVALFRHQQFDILHFHAVTASYLQPIRQALRAGVPVVMHSHGSGAASSLRTRSLHHVNRLRLTQAAVTRIAVSGDAGRWMFGRSHFETLHNGIDLESFGYRSEDRKEARGALSIAPDALVVGLVGALLPVKNHSFGLQVFKQITNRRPDAVLLLVGEGALESSLRSEAEALGVAEQIRFLGRRTDMPALLSAMDSLILPSLHEGFPMVALEAQASGLPCFVSARVTAEVVLTPICHRLPLSSPSEWAREILARASPRPRFSEAPLLREAKVTVQDNANRIAQLYLSVARGRDSG